MTRSVSLCSLAGLLVFGVAFTWADRAPANGPPPPGFLQAPEPAKPAGLQIVVKIDPTAKVSRLILPPDAAGGEGMGEILPPSGIAPPAKPAPQEAPKGAFFESSTRTIFAGICLSLAIGAIFFVPRTSGAAQMLLMGVVGVSVSAIAAVALANKAPVDVPPPPQPVTQIASGAVKVEWTGRKGAPITLILASQDAQAVPGPIVRDPKAPPPVSPFRLNAPNAAPNAAPK